MLTCGYLVQNAHDVHNDGFMSVQSIRHPASFPNRAERAPFRTDRLVRIAWTAFGALSSVTTLTAVIATTVLSTPIAITALVVTSTASTVFLFIETYKSLHPHLPKRFQQVADHIKATVTDVFATFAVVAMTATNWLRKKPQNLGTEGQRPILLIHGYLSHGSHWRYHRYRLRCAGLGPVYTINLGHPFHTIEEYTEKVRAKIEEIKKITDRLDVTLVGHSMGGVVAAHYVTTHAEKMGTRVPDVVTIGSPLRGTKVARIGIGKCTRQMQGNSSFIQEIGKRVEKCVKTAFLHIGSRSDLVVRPTTSAFLGKDRAKHYVLPDVGHLRLIASDRVIDTVICHLKQRVSDAA